MKIFKKLWKAAKKAVKAVLQIPAKIIRWESEHLETGVATMLVGITQGLKKVDKWKLAIARVPTKIVAFVAWVPMMTGLIALKGVTAVTSIWVDSVDETFVQFGWIKAEVN